MFCPHCGHIIQPNDHYCAHCAYPVAAPATPVQAIPPRRRGALYIALGVFLLLIVLGSLVLVFTAGNARRQPASLFTKPIPTAQPWSDAFGGQAPAGQADTAKLSGLDRYVLSNMYPGYNEQQLEQMDIEALRYWYETFAFSEEFNYMSDAFWKTYCPDITPADQQWLVDTSAQMIYSFTYDANFDIDQFLSDLDSKGLRTAFECLGLHMLPPDQPDRALTSFEYDFLYYFYPFLEEEEMVRVDVDALRQAFAYVDIDALCQQFYLPLLRDSYPEYTRNELQTIADAYARLLHCFVNGDNFEFEELLPGEGWISA